MIENIVYYFQIAIIFIVSIGLHEYAHAYVSYRLGDPTPKIQGRLTPNPLKHIDPIGFILIFLIHFGWGKPVQIDPNYYKKPYRDELLVALAGPATNILLGVLAIIVMMLYMKLFGQSIVSISGNGLDMVAQFWMLFAISNFALAAFNMIPLPPLDGYRLIKVMHHGAGAFLERYVGIISLVFLVLVVFGPFKNVLSTYIHTVATGLFRIFSFPFAQLLF